MDITCICFWYQLVIRNHTGNKVGVHMRVVQIVTYSQKQELSVALDKNVIFQQYWGTNGAP